MKTYWKLWVCLVTMVYLGSLKLYSQSLLFLQGVDMTVDPGASLHIEGGIQLENNGQLRNSGDVYIGSNGSGYVPNLSHWINLNDTEPGNEEGFSGTVHLIQTDLEQAIMGTRPTHFNYLRVIGTARLDQEASAFRLILEEGELRLNAHDFRVEDGLPSGIELRGDLHQIISETHPDREGAYGNVYWEVAGAPIGSTYIIPFGAPGAKIQIGAYIPLEIQLGSEGLENLRVATYRTDILNQPLPVETGIGPDVLHVNDLQDKDHSFNFVDRFWIIDGGNNSLAEVRFNYDEFAEESGYTGSQPDALRAQVWEGTQWSYQNLGVRGNGPWVEIQDVPRSSGVWGLSLKPAPVSRHEELGIASLKLYPNPASTHAWLELQLNQVLPVEVRVFDVAGKWVGTPWNPPLAQEYRYVLDVQALAKGMYQVQIRVGEDIVRQKLIKR